jgi:hypothetical protein
MQCRVIASAETHAADTSAQPAAVAKAQKVLVAATAWQRRIGVGKRAASGSRLPPVATLQWVQRFVTKEFVAMSASLFVILCTLTPWETHHMHNGGNNVR